MATSADARVYDAIVIGSGQGGTPLASALAKAGRKTALIEKEHIGGCCINEGCTPTKTLIASGRMAYSARRMGDYGVNIDGKITVDMKKVRQRKRDIVQSFQQGSTRRLGDAGVDVLTGKAEFVGEKAIKVGLNQGGEVMCKSELVFINVGERPAMPRLDGLADVISQMPQRVLTSTTIMELDEVPETLLVLGGGYVGLEFAHLFLRLGSKVHVVQRRDRILPREDAEVTDCLHKILAEEGMQIHCLADAVSISAADASSIKLSVRSPSTGDAFELHGTHVLLAAGRQPNNDTLNLSAAGVAVDARGYISANEFLETTAAGVYALGDCKGPPAFTHVSYDDFRIVRDNLDLLPHPSASPLDKPLKPHGTGARKDATPQVMYTDPQLGHVGLHVHDIPASERKMVKVARMPMSYVARALENDDSRGMMKAVVNGDTGEILGFSCLGAEGGEIMSIMQTAMMGGMKWWQLREAVWAHPTYAESLNNIWGFLEDA